MVAPETVILTCASGAWNVKVSELRELKPAHSLQFLDDQGD